MKPLFPFTLAAILSPIAFAHPAPQLSPEQTIRQIYQRYTDGSTPTFFTQQASARLNEAITLNTHLTPPDEVPWLNFDPVCACQDYDNLVLEKVTIVQKDAAHADAAVSFRPFKSNDFMTIQTIRLVAENNNWLIDDVISDDDSLYQQINQANLDMARK